MSSKINAIPLVGVNIPNWNKIPNTRLLHHNMKRTQTLNINLRSARGIDTITIFLKTAIESILGRFSFPLFVFEIEDCNIVFYDRNLGHAKLSYRYRFIFVQWIHEKKDKKVRTNIHYSYDSNMIAQPVRYLSATNRYYHEQHRHQIRIGGSINNAARVYPHWHKRDIVM